MIGEAILTALNEEWTGFHEGARQLPPGAVVDALYGGTAHPELL
jgi:hypothetical protein